jgi:hypothetical protein
MNTYLDMSTVSQVILKFRIRHHILRLQQKVQRKKVCPASLVARWEHQHILKIPIRKNLKESLICSIQIQQNRCFKLQKTSYLNSQTYFVLSWELPTFIRIAVLKKQQRWPINYYNMIPQKNFLIFRT